MTPSTQDARATGLVELAVRCEQATGADRELDALVAAAIRHFPVNVGYIWQGEMKANSPEVGCVECCTRSGTGGPWYKAKSYTASIDAAMMLVPEGWAISSMSAWPASPEDATNPTPPTASVELVGTSLERWGRKMVWGHKGSDGRVQSTATDLPRALTAAALRALAASTKDMNHDG